MKTVSGYVENITFRNEDNGFTVLTLSSGKEDITCTGNFGYIGQGEYVEIEGEEVFHEIYGKQIKATNYKIVPATDELSLKKYLGSGAIKGLGAVLMYSSTSSAVMPRPVSMNFRVFFSGSIMTRMSFFAFSGEVYSPIISSFFNLVMASHPLDINSL